MKKTIAIVVLFLVVAGAFYAIGRSGKSVSDAIIDTKTEILGTIEEWKKEWPEDKRIAYPERYARYVERCLQNGVDKCEEHVKNIERSTAKLQINLDKNQSKLEKIGPMLNDFMGALDKGEYPVELYGGKYDEAQLRTQIGVIMTSQKQAQSALETGKDLRNKTDKEKARLLKMIEQDKNALAEIDSKINLLKAQKLTDEGKKLIQNMSDAFEANATFKYDPIGSVDDLLDRAENDDSIEDANALIDQRLEEYRASKNTKE
ncbi:MAG: hypothetical protein IJU03_12980 [Thermoguttaceae bacterium]|nr:hypothetical protein [Thermoguttaceae bacterium]